MIVILIGLSTAGWTLFLLSIKKIKEKDTELSLRNAEMSLLHALLQQSRASSKREKEKIIYINRPTEISKEIIDAVKLAMKVSHPDNGGTNENFIKYNEVYQKLTGKGR